MTSIRPRSDAEYIRSQREAIATLDLILRSAENAGLPPLRWSLIAFGTLHGQALDFSTDTRRATFDAWVEHLGATHSSEWTTQGTTHLRAAATDVFGQPVRLALTAELFDVDDEGGCAV